MSGPKMTERVCRACGNTFTEEVRAGRPHVLCPVCRLPEVIGDTVRVFRRPSTPEQPARLCLRRPGQKTKYVTKDLTPSEIDDLVRDLLMAKVGIVEKRREEKDGAGTDAAPPRTPAAPRRRRT